MAGGVALALLAMPVATRATEDIMRLQPFALREAGMALGANRGHVIRAIIWRASKSGLMTGALLSFARISGETAPAAVHLARQRISQFQTDADDGFDADHDLSIRDERQ